MYSEFQTECPSFETDWELFMYFNLKNVVCIIRKGMALPHENYGVRYLSACSAANLYVEGKGGQVCKTEMYSMEASLSSHQ